MRSFTTMYDLLDRHDITPSTKPPIQGINRVQTHTMNVPGPVSNTNESTSSSYHSLHLSRSETVTATPSSPASLSRNTSVDSLNTTTSMSTEIPTCEVCKGTCGKLHQAYITLSVTAQVVFLSLTLVGIPNLWTRSKRYYERRRERLGRQRQHEQKQLDIDDEDILHCHQNDTCTSTGTTFQEKDAITEPIGESFSSSRTKSESTPRTDPVCVVKSQRTSRRSHRRRKSLNHLPVEVKYILCRFLDARTICRLSQTNSVWHAICTDDRIWAQQYFSEWGSPCSFAQPSIPNSTTTTTAATTPFYRPKIPFSQRRPRYTTFYTMFRIRWTSSGAEFSTISKEEREDRLGWRKGILEPVFLGSLNQMFHILMTPLKAVGVISSPVYFFCDRFVPFPQDPSLSCLRYLVMDLTITAKSCFNYRDMHLFGIVNLAALVLLILDEISIALAGVYCFVFTLASGGMPFGWHSNIPEDYTSVAKWILFLWQLLFIPMMILFHLQLMFLPTCAVFNTSLHYLWTGESLSISDTWLYQVLAKGARIGYFDDIFWFFAKRWPTLFAIALQIIWAPVMCAIEELTLRFARLHLDPSVAEGTWSSPLLLVQKGLRVFTLAVQCCFGVLAYSFLILVSVLHKSVR